MAICLIICHLTMLQEPPLCNKPDSFFSDLSATILRHKNKNLFMTRVHSDYTVCCAWITVYFFLSKLWKQGGSVFHAIVYVKLPFNFFSGFYFHHPWVP